MNTKELDAVFERLLNQDTRRDVMVKSLRAGGEILLNATRQSLASKVPTADSKMQGGIKLGIDKDYVTVWVSILKEYRLKWFEAGTDERYRKIRSTDERGRTRVNRSQKGGYTGKMFRNSGGRWFFKQARESTQDDCANAISAEFDRQIGQLWK